MSDFLTARFLLHPLSPFSSSPLKPENPFSDDVKQDPKHETGDLGNKTGPEGFEHSTCGLKVRRSSISGSEAH